MPAKIGSIPWNKGIHLSESIKAKMNFSGLELGRAWNKGKAGLCSKETIRKMSESHMGHVAEHSGNWRGGSSKAYKTGFDSPEYKKWRKAVFERDDYQCQKCGTKSGNGHATYLTAHHIKPYSKFRSLRHEASNGITLCEPCHCQEDNYRARFMNKVVANV